LFCNISGFGVYLASLRWITLLVYNLKINVVVSQIKILRNRRRKKLHPDLPTVDRATIMLVTKILHVNPVNTKERVASLFFLFAHCC
jgi:hypothetical protein